jgi:hypothetical protein
MSKYILIFLLICQISTITIKCPKYKCVESIEAKCASVSSTLSRLGYNNIELMDVCPKSQSCQVYPNSIWETLTNLNSNKSFFCKSPSINRYPGEDCNVDYDCMKFDNEVTGKCKNNFCTGLVEGQKCYKIHTLCKAGSYCDPEEDVCRTQKNKGQPCKSSYECVNDLFCDGLSCDITPFGLVSGSVINNPADPFVEYFCEYGQYRKDRWYGFKCTIIKQEKPDTMIQCQIGEKCKYTYGNGEELEKDCECGFNENGQGYCPLGMNFRKFNF